MITNAELTKDVMEVAVMLWLLHPNHNLVLDIVKMIINVLIIKDVLTTSVMFWHLKIIKSVQDIVQMIINA